MKMDQTRFFKDMLTGSLPGTAHDIIAFFGDYIIQLNYGVIMESVRIAGFLAGYNGAITAQISIPVSQTAYFSDLGTNIDVGGFEIMVGYRFIL